jgi:putative tryptophan/tyrosine transport system substrate-binding protein
VTGLSGVFTDLAAKQVEILKDAMPSLSSVALLVNSSPHLTTNFREIYIAETQKAADGVHAALQVIQASSPEELEKALSAAADAHSNAVLIIPDGLMYQQRKLIAELAIEKGLPTVGWEGDGKIIGAVTPREHSLNRRH